MGISIWQLLIVLAIILLLFGTKRLRNLGGDLGGAIKGFKRAMEDKPEERLEPTLSEKSNTTTPPANRESADTHSAPRT